MKPFKHTRHQELFVNGENTPHRSTESMNYLSLADLCFATSPILIRFKKLEWFTSMLPPATETACHSIRSTPHIETSLCLGSPVHSTRPFWQGLTCFQKQVYLLQDCNKDEKILSVDRTLNGNNCCKHNKSSILYLSEHAARVIRPKRKLGLLAHHVPSRERHLRSPALAVELLDFSETMRFASRYKKIEQKVQPTLYIAADDGGLVGAGASSKSIKYRYPKNLWHRSLEL